MSLRNLSLLMSTWKEKKQNSFTNANPALSPSTPSMEFPASSPGTAMLWLLTEFHHHHCSPPIHNILQVHSHQGETANEQPLKPMATSPTYTLRIPGELSHLYSLSICTHLRYQMHVDYLELTISWNKTSKRKKVQMYFAGHLLFYSKN